VYTERNTDESAYDGITPERASRLRLGQVVCVAAKLHNWLADRAEKGLRKKSPSRRHDWVPPVTETEKRLVDEAAKLVNAKEGSAEHKEYTRFFKLYDKGEYETLAEHLLSAEQEQLVAKKGDTDKTWELVEATGDAPPRKQVQGDQLLVRKADCVVTSVVSDEARCTPFPVPPPAPKINSATFTSLLKKTSAAVAAVAHQRPPAGPAPVLPPLSNSPETGASHRAKRRAVSADSAPPLPASMLDPG
jgi:hypothetical protein